MKITLKAARVNAGYSAEEAAEKLGITSRTLWNWENGKSYPDVRDIPDIERVYKIEYKDINFFCESMSV